MSSSEVQPKPKILTPHQLQGLQAAHGKLHVLCVGISDYSATSGFAALPVCANDAIKVGHCFQDVKELNADPSRIRVISSKNAMVSKGVILQAVHKLACDADEDDRILFYFSGHGQRLDDNNEFYLVPQDAFRHDHADTLLSFDQVLDLLKESTAKQKIVIIDACFSGPSDLKKPLSSLSPKQLTDYLNRTEGVVILSSSSSDQASWAKSPDKDLSLFTWALVNALRGEPDAQQDRFLTINTLFDFVCGAVHRESKSYGAKQTPVRKLIEEGGSIILGNFNAPLVTPQDFDLEGAPITAIEFGQNEAGRVDDVLQSIKNYNYSLEYLERRVNDTLGEHLADSLGELTCSIADAADLDLSEVNVDGAGITFPGGSYTVTYEANPGDKKRGTFVHRIQFDSSWFDQAAVIPEILNAVDMRPRGFKLHLTKEIDPQQLIPGLRARHWSISKKLVDKIEARSGVYTLEVTCDAITFGGMLPSEILGDEADQVKSQLVAGVLFLMT